LRGASRGLLAGGFLAAAGGPLRAFAQGDSFQPFWVQNFAETELWSAPDNRAISLGRARQFSFLRVDAPPEEGRYYVWNPQTRAFAWVDVSAVGASDPPASIVSRESSNSWVSTFIQTPLWSSAGPDAITLGTVEQFHPFQVMGTAGPRLQVRDPRMSQIGFIDAAAVGPADAPTDTLAPTARWWGYTESGVNLRSGPTTESRVVGELPGAVPIVVEKWVGGQEVLSDQPTWAQLADGVFAYSAILRAVKLEVPPPPPGSPGTPRWVDVNLTHQVIVAYEGTNPVYSARYSSGRPGWETTTGTFRIGRRVENEIMESNSLLGAMPRGRTTGSRTSSGRSTSPMMARQSTRTIGATRPCSAFLPATAASACPKRTPSSSGTGPPLAPPLSSTAECRG